VKVAVTLAARDEGDVVEAYLAHHLNAGADVVVATDHASQDETGEILERWSRDGSVHLLREEDPGFDQRALLTRMARIAATELGADWVLHADADEFWWPRSGTIKDVLAAVPQRYGVVRGLVQYFVVRPDDDRFFTERMDVRLVRSPVQDPVSTGRPFSKVAHRADPGIRIGVGAHGVTGTPLVPMTSWTPFEVLHFSVRNVEQCRRKFANRAAFWTTDAHGPGPIVERAQQEIVDRGAREFYDSLAVADDVVARGLREGSLLRDTRLRDELRRLGAPDRLRREPSPVAPGGDGHAPLFAHEVAMLDLTEETRLNRRVDELERRIEAVERRGRRRRR
jgi:hypothetical protein